VKKRSIGRSLPVSAGCLSAPLTALDLPVMSPRNE
jgi:hypothetical protein